MVQFSEDYRDSPVAVHRHGGRRSCSHAATSGFQLSAATVEVPQILSSTAFEGEFLRTPPPLGRRVRIFGRAFDGQQLLVVEGSGWRGRWESDSQVFCHPY